MMMPFESASRPTKIPSRKRASAWSASWKLPLVNFFILLLFTLLFQSCAAPKGDIATDEGRENIYSATIAALTRGDCDGAIQIIDPLYQSRYSTNRARTLRASAYGCRAGIDFFTMISNLTTANLSGGSFWNSMARIFPDTGGHMEATWQAQDALLSVIRTGTYVSTVNQITTNAYNPGSVIASDRTQDANTYLIFISLAVIGTTENRYGNPDPNNNYNQRQTLPWTAAALVNETGCSMASAILNLFDAIHEVSGTATGNLATSLNTISSLQSSFDAACGGTCSTLLRNRESCTGAATQENIDAAAIINVVNASWP